MKSVSRELSGESKCTTIIRSGEALATVTPMLRTSAGKPRLRDRHAILNLHLRDIEVGTEVERNGDREAAVTRRIRRDEEHVLDAVDLLLERRSDRRGHDLGAGARILPGDVDHGRRDLGILRNRQTADARPRRG